MSGLIDGVSLVSGIATLISFIEGLAPASNVDITNNKVHVTVGLADPGASADAGSTAGTIDHFYGYNANNLAFVSGSGGHIDAGSGGHTYTLDTGYNGQSSDGVAEYISVTAADDAICIQALGLTTSQGDRYAWDGDNFRYCGLSWHYGGNLVGNQKDNGDDYRPACGWLDHNGDAGPQDSVKLHMPNFGDQTTHDANFYCEPPVQQTYSPDENNGGPLKKARGTKRTQHPAENRLMTTPFAQESARELCEDDNSYGPDLVNFHEGLYCDMATKTLHPLCTNAVSSNCIDFDVQNMNMTGVARKRDLTKQFASLIVHQ